MKYILAVLVMTFSMQSTADNWLCIADKATGFTLKNGSWESTNFTSGEKYIIKEADDNGKLYDAVYQVHAFGRDTPSWLCGDFRSDMYTEKLLVCDGLGTPSNTFKYNPRTGNFLATRTSGYVEDFDGVVNDDTPAIVIGKCSKL